MHQGSQQQFFIRPRQPVNAREIEVRPVDVGLLHGADLIPVGARGADDRAGIAVQQFWLQQHQVAELQRTGQAVIGQQRDGCAHVGFAELLAGQGLLQPLRQFGEAQQADVGRIAHLHHGVLQLGEDLRRRGPWQLIPRDAVRDESLQVRWFPGVRLVRAVLAVLGAGLQPAGENGSAR